MTDHAPTRPALSQAQETFVANVLAADPPACFALEAPPGTGKGTAAVEFIRRLSVVDPQLRALVLCPAALVQQFAARLSMAAGSIHVEAIERSRYRELEAAVPIGASPFPAATVVVLSIDLAKHEDVARGLLLTRWQALIVDEAHRLTGLKADVVRNLLEARVVDRAVLMSATLPPTLPPGAVVTRWAAGPVSAEATTEGLLIRPVSVKYTVAEQAAFKAADTFADELTRSGFASVGSAVRSNAESSLFALEQALREMRNRAAHGAAPDEAPQSHDALPPSLIIVSAERVLAALDDVEVDSKTEALCAILTAYTGSSTTSSTVVVTRFRRTAEYLAEALAGRGFRSRCLTGDMPSDEIADAVHQLNSPGVTIMTYAAMKGFEFPPVDTWVIYEPGDDKGLYVAVTRTRLAGAAQSIKVFTFQPPESQESR